MLFDTHAHYDDAAFDADRDQLLKGLPNENVGLVLCPAANLSSARACIGLAAAYDYIYAAVGVHPQDAGELEAGWLTELEALTQAAKVCAIGEIGLDYYYEDVPRHIQKDVFRAQIELAKKLKLPVIVHDREAHADSMEIVRAYPDVTGVFHCYSGGVEDAKRLVERGWSISFTGTVTFKNARKAPEVIRAIPLECILIETDAPYMAPEPFRGKRNQSAYVYRVAEAIAEIKNRSVEEVIAQTTENGKKLFHITKENII
ncbi:MAG: TatD family hydrolase [Evtepia sp.]